MKIFVCRHGETNWNVEGKIKGQNESLQTTFTDVGKWQINELIRFIIKYDCEAVFTSDMIRTYDTAKLIADATNLPLYTSTNFRGLNVGNLQGVSKKEFDSSDVSKRVFADYDFPFPAGESINMLFKRLFAGLNEIRESYNFKNVAVITHGTVISNLRAKIMNDKFIPIDYCVIESYEQGWTLIDFGIYKDFLGKK